MPFPFLEDFRWHDLRHTWASWHVQAGTSLSKLQEMGGWDSIEMVRRYAHLAPEHLAVEVANIEDLLQGMNGTNMAQATPWIISKIISACFIWCRQEESNP